MMIELLLRTGVKGYVGKSQPLDDLSEAISMLLRQDLAAG